jgi:hypothetical protein
MGDLEAFDPGLCGRLLSVIDRLVSDGQVSYQQAQWAVSALLRAGQWTSRERLFSALTDESGTLVALLTTPAPEPSGLAQLPSGHTSLLRALEAAVPNTLDATCPEWTAAVISCAVQAATPPEPSGRPALDDVIISLWHDGWLVSHTRARAPRRLTPSPAPRAVRRRAGGAPVAQRRRPLRAAGGVGPLPRAGAAGRLGGVRRHSPSPLSRLPSARTRDADGRGGRGPRGQAALGRAQPPLSPHRSARRRLPRR